MHQNIKYITLSIIYLLKSLKVNIITQLTMYIDKKKFKKRQNFMQFM